MTKELLEAMLQARSELRFEDANFVTDEEYQMALLIDSTGGPMPLARIEKVSLGNDFLTVQNNEATWCLPYDKICGLKMMPKKPQSAARAGFRN